MIKTEAWVLYRGERDAPAGPAVFRREEYCFPDIADDEMLVEPLYGCWEANMTHAISRDPIDICRARREDRIVLGNAGVVRIARVGRAAVTTAREGDLAMISPLAAVDRFGYLTKVMAYDAPNTMGILAKQAKVKGTQVIVLPEGQPYSLPQWAAFSARYVVAWANWRIAYGCWRVQMPEHLAPTVDVFAWGGGVSIAELTLAAHFGGRAFMAASTDYRLQLIEQCGITPFDRRLFPDLKFDDERYATDHEYKRRYLASESTFLALIRSATEGLGASIIIDNIGRPVFRASLRALARQGVLTSQGWKLGMELGFTRASECISRHIQVCTHGFSAEDAIAATRFAIDTGWVPSDVDEVYGWEDVAQLACDYACGRVKSYFPLFEVNRC